MPLRETPDDEAISSHVIYDRRKGWFRPEISLGNVIQLVMLMFAVFMAWAQLSKDQEVLRTRFDLYIQEQQRREGIKESLEEVQKMINDLDKKLDAKTLEIRRRIG